MKLKYQYFSPLVLLLLLTINTSFAKTDCNVKVANDILRCLQNNHPELIEESVVNAVSEKLQSQSLAWKNPEVSFESVAGQNLGSTVIESEFRLSQTVELSGQRRARKNKSIADIEAFKADSLGKLEEVTLKGVKYLYRLLQIQNETVKIDEALKQFRGINQLYKSRPRLSPENETTLGIIQLAISQFEIKKNQITAEKNELLSELTSTTGLSAEVIMGNLPGEISLWPNMEKTSGQLNNSELNKLKAQVDGAESNLRLARAEAWPEFTFDFIVQNNIEGSLQYQTFGAGIRLPLPVFQRNEGEKALRAVEFSKSQNVYKSQKQRQEIAFENAVNIYRDSIGNINNFPSLDSIEKKHKKAETFFSQGMISGPLIIEVHRQIIDYYESKNQEEMRALESLWKIYILNGNFQNKQI